MLKYIFFPVDFCRVLRIKSVRWSKAKWQGLNLKFWWWHFKGKENKSPDYPEFSAAENYVQREQAIRNYVQREQDIRNYVQREQAIRKWRSDLNEYINYQAYCHEILHQQNLRKINQEESFWKRLINVRPLWVLLSGIISFIIFYYIYQKFFAIQYSNTTNSFPSNPTTYIAIFGTLLSLIVSAPVLFFIWFYRDQNNCQQIENQRKDINLKDFQKLADWASGQHFTDQEKEQHVSPRLSHRNAANHAISKHQGAESLQIAAIYQITTFLKGAYGVHFQRPAFQLLKSIWQAYVQTYVGKNPEPTLLNENEVKLTPDEWEERKKNYGNG